MPKAPTLTVQLMHAQARIVELEAQLAEANTKLVKRSTFGPRPAYVAPVREIPEWQKTRLAAMAAAREEAMRTGCVVLAA